MLSLTQENKLWISFLLMKAGGEIYPNETSSYSEALLCKTLSAVAYKHTKSLQDDIKHAVMKPQISIQA